MIGLFSAVFATHSSVLLNHGKNTMSPGNFTMAKYSLLSVFQYCLLLTSFVLQLAETAKSAMILLNFHVEIELETLVNALFRLLDIFIDICFYRTFTETSMIKISPFQLNFTKLPESNSEP